VSKDDTKKVDEAPKEDVDDTPKEDTKNVINTTQWIGIISEKKGVVSTASQKVSFCAG